MKRTKNGYTLKQFAYAQKKLNGKGRNKKEIALSVGFSPAVAANAKNKIEDTEGFANATIQLAAESNNIVLAIMAEYRARGLRKFSNKDLNGALNAISSAWDKFNKQQGLGKNKDPEINPLRRVLMQRVENQTVNITPTPAPATIIEVPQAQSEFVTPEGEGLDLDF